MNTFDDPVVSIPRERSLRARAKLALDGAMLEARADRVGAHGMSLMVDRKADEHAPCEVSLRVFLNGRHVSLSAKGEISSCSCAGMEGFRIAVRFTGMDQEAAHAVRQLVRLN